MIGNFIDTYRRLLDGLSYKHHRYILDDFNISNRLTGLIGARGTGKTTLLLQFIHAQVCEGVFRQDECMYVSVDHIHFSHNTLIAFVTKLYEDYGIRYYFLDEIHKYPGWNQELKNIYDAYTDITIVFSGSSSIDLVQGAYDLSRRGVLFRLGGMSFREYLLFNESAHIAPVSYEYLLTNHGELETKLADIPRLKGHFKAYLDGGYYPFFLEDRDSYKQKMLRVIEKTVFEDIANHYKLKTENLFCFKRILAYLSSIPPGELNRNSIAKHIGIDYKTVEHYLQILHETGLVELIGENRAGSRILKTTEKIYLDNPNLYYAISDDCGCSMSKGTVREIFFVKMITNSGHHIHYSRKGDFEVEGSLFEIGGKSKGRKQIRQAQQDAWLVKDDILYGNQRELPLHLFGFLY